MKLSYPEMNISTLLKILFATYAQEMSVLKALDAKLHVISPRIVWQTPLKRKKSMIVEVFFMIVREIIQLGFGGEAPGRNVYDFQNYFHILSEG